jgi:hypothetical protein
MRMLRVGFSGLDFFILEPTVELDGCKCFPSLTPLIDQFRYLAPPFYENRRLITAFATARHLSISWTTCRQYPPRYYFFKVNFNINLPLCQGLQSSLILSGALPNRVSIFLSSAFDVRPIHIIIWWAVQIMTALITQFLQHSVTSSLFGPYVFRRNPMLNTISFSSWICVSQN